MEVLETSSTESVDDLGETNLVPLKDWETSFGYPTETQLRYLRWHRDRFPEENSHIKKIGGRLFIRKEQFLALMKTKYERGFRY